MSASRRGLLGDKSEPSCGEHTEGIALPFREPTYQNASELRKTIDIHKRSLRKDADRFAAYARIARCYQQLDDKKNALRYLEKIKGSGSLHRNQYIAVADWLIVYCEFRIAESWLREAIYTNSRDIELYVLMRRLLLLRESFDVDRRAARTQYRGSIHDQEFIDFVVAHGRVEEYLERNPEARESGLGAYGHWFRFGFLKKLTFPGIEFEVNSDREFSGLWRYFRFRGRKVRARRTIDQPRNISLGAAVGTLQSLPKKASEVQQSHPLAQELIFSSLEKFRRSGSAPGLQEKLPTVSVVMTTYNSEATVVRSVESLLFQTWPNLEIVLVDDASNDNTWTLISGLSKQYKRTITAIRLEANIGSYLAKNIGINRCRGEIVMFQDSDDYSHPSRVEVQARGLCVNTDKIGNRTQYCRVDPSTKAVVPIDGLYARLGLITLAVRRSAFKEVGYFDAVRKAGDNEWFDRARLCYGKSAFEDIPVCLYSATMMPHSIAQDLFHSSSEGGIIQIVTGPRADYLRRYGVRHANFTKKKKNLLAENPPLPLVSAQWIPREIAAIPMKRLPVVAAVCSIPQRVASLERVVASVIDQVDYLHVYLDKYDTVPAFLRGNSKISITRSQSVKPDYRDNAKFLKYDHYKKSHGEIFYLTIDDDIVYPADYVIYHMRVSEAFGRRCVTGLHGVVYNENPGRYFGNRRVYHYEKDVLKSHVLVNCLGTGTTGFYSSCFASMNPRQWVPSGMVDIHFSVMAKTANVPLVCMARNPGWLRDSVESDKSPTLYGELQSKDHLISSVLMKHSPWGYQAIADTIEKLSNTMRLNLQAHLPEFSGDANIDILLKR
jgi:glycosyltransferase involved in cell wall biosynthesis